MSAIDGLGLVLFAGLAAYAVLGGADFGAGLCDLTRHRDQRDLVTRAMGPVWEANHVWLIFVVITLFTGFPGAFGALSRALTGPLSLALLGIVLRGAAFVFRQYAAPHGGPPVRGTVLWGRVFAVSSLLTPFTLGAAGAALVEGGLHADGSAGLWRPFLTPLALVGGLLAVTCCAYLAAVYLTRDAERAGAGRVGAQRAGAERAGAQCAGAGRAGADALVRRLRRRALITGVLAGALALAALRLLPPGPAVRLLAVGRPAVALSAAAGSLALVLLWRQRHSVARVAAAAAPAGLLAGWALALYPWALPGAVRLTDTAAPAAIAGPVLGVLVAGLTVVLPAYVLLLRVLRVRPEPAG